MAAVMMKLILRENRPRNIQYQLEKNQKMKMTVVRARPRTIVPTTSSVRRKLNKYTW